MTRRHDDVLLYDMLAAIKLVEEYLVGASREEFLRDVKTQDAVVRRIEIIGEASRNLSPSFVEEHPEIDWHRIVGLRNRIAHGYFDIDFDAVWKVTASDLPALRRWILGQLGPDAESRL